MKKYKVVLDPGHGGGDPGAVGPTWLKESHVNWKIACMVADQLEKHEIEVVLTRNGDMKVSLDERVQIANQSNADFFVSIHINSATNPKATGTETYAYAKGVIGDRLAHSIQNSLVNEIHLADRGVKYNSLQVIRDTKMPACLVEVAFINNPSEEQLLRTSEFLEMTSIGITKGILEFLGISYIISPNEENKVNLEVVESGLSSWAKESMEWAIKNRLTDGTNSNEPVSLERFITILHRYDKLK